MTGEINLAELPADITITPIYIRSKSIKEKGCQVLQETRYLREKCVEVTAEACKVEGCKIGEPFEEAMKKRVCWIIDSERESKMVGDGEKPFRDHRERFHVTVVVFTVVGVVEEYSSAMAVVSRFVDVFPNLRGLGLGFFSSDARFSF
ncbi:hypothetical protein L195_g043229 [Trifolium pratense]|uniref:Uncharacterized protein n=1 Tax=Trifolium pratense TaxID=57577 RepID=A0A2K3M8R1_TRIPR|nr:hypothetical protein L195_g043229 [Trifolium pratense]